MEGLRGYQEVVSVFQSALDFSYEISRASSDRQIAFSLRASLACPFKWNRHFSVVALEITVQNLSEHRYAITFSTKELSLTNNSMRKLKRFERYLKGRLPENHCIEKLFRSIFKFKAPETPKELEPTESRKRARAEVVASVEKVVLFS